MISKALTWVLKRTVEEGEGNDEGEEKLVCDAEGWVDCEKVLQRQNIEALQVTFPELQTLIASSTSKQRFALKLKQTSEVGSEVASDWVIRTNSSQNSSPSSPTPGSASKLTPLTTTSKDLPDLIVYETSYANYPLILASGGIKRAGGQAHLQFSCIKIKDDGTEARPFSDADVSIYINLRAVMESNPKVEWLRAENGNIMTEGDANGGLEKKHWKKAVGRRADIGVLFEDGEVRKEIPIGLRGKGVKGKRGGGKGKGRGLKEMKARSEDEGTGSD